jgi:hypothetical protein
MARQLTVQIVGDASKLQKATQEATGNLHRVGKVAAVAGAALTGAFVVGLKKSVDAAKEAQVSQENMESALKAAGISFRAHAKQIDSVIQSTSKLAALDDEDLQDAFTRLTRTTGSVNSGLKDMRIAANLARGAQTSIVAPPTSRTSANPLCSSAICSTAASSADVRGIQPFRSVGSCHSSRRPRCDSKTLRRRRPFAGSVIVASCLILPLSLTCSRST